jgi:hypothetical protein
VRYTPEEIATVRARAAACGRTLARYVREASLGAMPRERRRSEIGALVLQLIRVGNNLNQLARAANSDGRFPLEARIDAVLAELLAAIRRID